MADATTTDPKLIGAIRERHQQMIGFAWLSQARTNQDMEEIRYLLDAVTALHAERDRLEAWKAKEQTALLRMAATLLMAGFRGDGVDEGVEWLAAEAARLRAALEDCRAYLNGRAPVLDGMALLSEVKAALASSGTVPERPKNG